ncbi:UNVERIFIED_CONTAM: hypothetical protein FKN15_069308 [Acipenser sinensis]
MPWASARDVAKAVRKVAKRATQEFRLQSYHFYRADTPPHITSNINAEIVQGSAQMPSVHLAHPPTLSPWQLYDRVHLNQEAVWVFDKSLKDTAMGRSQASPPKRSIQPLSDKQLLVPSAVYNG